jgi:sugar lactone lactonase YvrE
MDVEQMTDPLAAHGEGPVWWQGWGGLRWVDMNLGDVIGFDPGTGCVSKHHVSSLVACIRPRLHGGAVLGVERGFALLEAGEDGAGFGCEATPLGDLWSDPCVRMNEGSSDPAGRFYCGSWNTTRKPGGGAVYRLDRDHHVVVAIENVSLANGLAWSPDGSTAYFVDTPKYTIDAYDHDPEGGLSHQRVAVELPTDKGGPDGLTVDAEGCLWLSFFGGGVVHRYRPDGTLDGVIELPVTQVTACAFGGPELDDLYITTSQLTVDVREQPLAGALFRAKVGVRGLAVVPFAG